MGYVNTYTATPCGPNPGPNYEIAKNAGDSISEKHLAAVRISDDPEQWKCCTVDRTQVNSTPEEDVKYAEDSEFPLDQCSECNQAYQGGR